MDVNILRQDVQEFIDSNLSVDISTLALRKNPFPNIEWRLILNQISAKSKAREKLPTWFAASRIYYPERISIEQSSSETTAEYKSGLVNGESLIDLSGGFGVDDYYFSKKIKYVAHCELNAELSSIVKTNFETLGVDHVECFSGESEETLKDLNRQWDWIYVDPSRRHDLKGKVFLLTDCVPNVPELLDFYFQYSDQIMIKSSPLLDLSAGLAELRYVTQIQVVAVNNEVKELLWIISSKFTSECEITTVNILKDHTDEFTFKASDDAQVNYELPKRYLYEPNAAILKAGAFLQVAVRFGLSKLHPHSHLYTSEHLVDFPGRRFRTEKIWTYGKSEMKTLAGEKMNITTRNFPETVESLRKRWKIADGGDKYCFFTTDINEQKIALICSKI